MQEGMSDEDAIQKAESEYHGQVNLVEDKAIKINEKQMAIQKELRRGVYPSEIVLSKVVDHLQTHYNSDSEYNVVKMFCRELLTKINDDTLEVANAE
jgi:4-hydroxy-L-threonine phosphate dehydrogenase PdxA